MLSSTVHVPQASIISFRYHLCKQPSTGNSYRKHHSTSFLCLQTSPAFRPSPSLLLKGPFPPLPPIPPPSFLLHRRAQAIILRGLYICYYCRNGRRSRSGGLVEGLDIWGVRGRRSRRIIGGGGDGDLGGGEDGVGGHGCWRLFWVVGVYIGEVVSGQDVAVVERETVDLLFCWSVRMVVGRVVGLSLDSFGRRWWKVTGVVLDVRFNTVNGGCRLEVSHG